METKTFSEAVLLRIFRSLDADAKQTILAMVKSAADALHDLSDTKHERKVTTWPTLAADPAKR